MAFHSSCIKIIFKPWNEELLMKEAGNQDQKDPTHTANFGGECDLVYSGALAVKHPGLGDSLIEELKETER